MSQLELNLTPEPPEFIETCWNRVDAEGGLNKQFCELDCITCHRTLKREFSCSRELELYGRTHQGSEWSKAKERIEAEQRKEEKSLCS